MAGSLVLLKFQIHTDISGYHSKHNRYSMQYDTCTFTIVSSSYHYCIPVTEQYFKSSDLKCLSFFEYGKKITTFHCINSTETNSILPQQFYIGICHICCVSVIAEEKMRHAIRAFYCLRKWHLKWEEGIIMNPRNKIPSGWLWTALSGWWLESMVEKDLAFLRERFKLYWECWCAELIADVHEIKVMCL